MSESAIRIVAAAAGILLWIILWIAGTGFVWALILGFVVAVAVWVVLHMMFDGRVQPIEQARAPDRVAAPAAEPKAPPSQPGGATGGEYEEEPGDLPDLDTGPSAADAQPDADAKASVPSGASAAEAKPDAGRSSAKSSAEVSDSKASDTAKEAATVSAAEEFPADAGQQPEGLAEARSGGADDLKKIKGVGPKLEQLLNSLGIYHFDQIAAWGPKEIAWMDGNLKGFKGRVSRDAWVEQAKTLAKG